MNNPVCNYCKHLTDVNREIAPDRGWCCVWCNWQRTTAKACKFFEQKEIPAKKKFARPNVGHGNRAYAR